MRVARHTEINEIIISSGTREPRSAYLPTQAIPLTPIDGRSMRTLRFVIVDVR